MKRVILLTYHGLGHFNACFRIAKTLQRSYHVTFAGVAFFNNYVAYQGFQYYPLRTVPFGLGFETWTNTVAKKNFVHWRSVRDRWSNRLYRERLTELTKMIDELKPDCVLIDSLQSTDFIVLFNLFKERSIRVGFFQTMLPPILQDGRPPTNSLALPGEQKEIQNDIRIFKWRRHKKLLWQKIVCLGMDNMTLIRKMIKRNNIPSSLISSHLVPKAVVFNHIPELIVAPREFEYPDHEPLDFQHYIGFMYDHDRRENEVPELDQILSNKKQNGLHILYCSFGSVDYIRAGKVKAFVSKLFSAITNQYFLILSLPVNLQYTESIPDNVLLLKGAPQLKILSLADAFITHGGVNSIKESIHANVPMLVYPDDIKYDQRSNSSKVIFHQLGLRGSMEVDTTNDIRKKIEELISNPLYKHSLKEMQRIDNTYTDEKFMFLFEGLQPLRSIFDSQIPSSGVR